MECITPYGVLNYMTTYQQVSPNTLRPHPHNTLIYGDEDVSLLAKQIAESGWVSPLLITPERIIISGHRRWKASLQLGLERIPVEVKEFNDSVAELEALLLSNATRNKKTEQKVREAELWRDIETAQAKQRQIDLAGNRPNAKPDLSENFRTGSSKPQKGRTVDRLAARVGLGSGRTYEKAAKVVRTIDLLSKDRQNTSYANALRQILNEQSVNGAYQLLRKPAALRNAILGLIVEGKAKNVKEAEAMIDVASKDSSIHQWRSCWNCHHRGEMLDSQHFYCYKFGQLSFIEQGCDARGSQCVEWLERVGEYQPNQHLSHAKTFNVALPYDLKPILEAAAAVEEVTISAWVANLICTTLNSQR